jgi:hypothetical protein
MPRESRVAGLSSCTIWAPVVSTAMRRACGIEMSGRDMGLVAIGMVGASG